MTADDGDCFETCQGHPEPVTAGVQRELAETLWPLLSREVHGMAPGLARVAIPGVNPNALAAALLPTVQRLIDAEGKRAAAAALREFADGIYIDEGARYDDRVRIVAAAHRRAAALDPAGAASGETT